MLPGVTAAGPESAVARSHGLVNDPSPDADPVGDTKKVGAGSAERSAAMPWLRGFLGASESWSAQAASSGRSASAKRTALGSVRDSMCHPIGGVARVSLEQLPDPASMYRGPTDHPVQSSLRSGLRDAAAFAL